MLCFKEILLQYAQSIVSTLGECLQVYDNKYRFNDIKE